MYILVWWILSVLYAVITLNLCAWGAFKGIVSYLRGMWHTLQLMFATLLQLLIFLPLDVLHSIARLLFTSTCASNAHQASRLSQLTRHEISRIQRLCGDGHTITSSHVTLNQQHIRLHVVMASPKHQAKDAPLCMLLHGFPHGWHAWIHVIAPLVKAGYRVCVPDLRGYGLSDIPTSISSYRMSTLVADIMELMEIINMDTKHTGCYLMGHDWGGILAWLLCMSHPSHIHSCVIVNAPHPQRWLHSPSQLFRSWYIFLYQIPWLPELILSGILRSWLYDILHADGIYTRHETDVVWAALSQPGALKAAIDYYRAYFHYGTSGLPLARITSPPVAIIWGDADSLLDIHLVTTLNRNLVPSMHKLILIPGCGHHVPTIKPDLLVHHALDAFKCT